MNEQVSAADIERVEKELKDQREQILDWLSNIAVVITRMDTRISQNETIIQEMRAERQNKNGR